MILGILRADDLWANSVDPDQTAPEGSALFAILSDLGVCVGGGGRGSGSLWQVCFFDLMA